MSGFLGIALLLTSWTVQSDAIPAYVREGNRIEQQFRAHRERLDDFFRSLRRIAEQRAPELLRDLEDAPPAPVIYGYQLLPRIVPAPPAANSEPVRAFSYSWPITEGYIENEENKLLRAQGDLRQLEGTLSVTNPAALARLIREYRELVANQRTVDQYIQYNRFWQRYIDTDRARFDELTDLYNLMQSGQPDVTAAIQDVLGKPDVPSFVEVRRPEINHVIVHVPVYTDIDDDAFLNTAKAAIEDMWHTEDADGVFALEIDFRKAHPSQLSPGEHLDVAAHAGRFPKDGAVLTTGAEFTHAFVGRYVALGPADLTARTLAHEFGHILGFRDGYIRGYRDLGDAGFEILELTSVLDDIMTAPRQGTVQPAHFMLIIDAVDAR